MNILMALAEELKEKGHNARYEVNGDCIFIESKEHITIIKDQKPVNLWASTFKCRILSVLSNEYFVGGVSIDLNKPDSINQLEDWLCRHS